MFSTLKVAVLSFYENVHVFEVLFSTYPLLKEAGSGFVIPCYKQANDTGPGAQKFCSENKMKML